MIKTFAVGNLAADAELRYHEKTPVLSWRMGCPGFKKDETTWLQCSLWGERAEKLADFLTKGKRFAVAGTLSVKEYERRDGDSGFSVECRVDDVQFCEKAGDGGGQGRGGGGGGGRSQGRGQQGRGGGGGNQNRRGGGGRDDRRDNASRDRGRDDRRDNASRDTTSRGRSDQNERDVEGYEE